MRYNTDYLKRNNECIRLQLLIRWQQCVNVRVLLSLVRRARLGWSSSIYVAFKYPLP